MRACACSCARHACRRPISGTISSARDPDRPKGALMGQYDCHVFVCTSGDTCPTQADTETYVKVLRAGVQKAGKRVEVRVNKAGCFSQCGHGPMIVVYPDDVWYAGVKESDLDEILTSHIVGGRPVERLRYNPGVPGPNKIDLPKKEVAHAPVAEAPVAQPASPAPGAGSGRIRRCARMKRCRSSRASTTAPCSRVSSTCGSSTC